MKKSTDYVDIDNMMAEKWEIDGNIQYLRRTPDGGIRNVEFRSRRAGKRGWEARIRQ